MKGANVCMRDKSQVIKVKKRRNINIGVIIFIVIVIYIVIYVITYFTNPRIAIYEVVEQNLSQNTQVTGIITRQETVVKATQSGYINYYFRDGTRVAKDTTVYSIDQNKRFYEKLNDISGNISYSQMDVADIKRSIKKYSQRLSYDNFAVADEYANDVTSLFLEIIEQHLMDNLQTIVDDTGLSSGFSVQKSTQSGIISYYSDVFDGLQQGDVTAKYFDVSDYQRVNLRSGSVIEQNAPVYKIFTDNDWNITALITPEQAELLKDKEKITFTVTLDQLVITAPMKVYQNSDGWFLSISLDRYLSNYSKERYLTLDLNLKQESGYKIPKTAITTKEFYLIPNDYLVQGGNTTQKGVMLVSYDETKGETGVTFKACDVYYQDDKFSYVNMDTFTTEKIIQNPKTSEKYQVNGVGKLQGVYNVNKGSAVFRRIEIIDQNDEYVIVKKDTSKGVSLYDHLALNAELTAESQIIY